MASDDAQREALARALNDDDVARRFAEPWEHCNAQTIDWYLHQADAALAWFHRQGQITEAMVQAERKAIHRSIVLNHFAAIAAADTWDQNDYEAMLNEFAVVALEAALNAKEDS